MGINIEDFVELYDNGNIKIKTTLINGKKFGNYSEFYENGKLKIETTFYDDRVIGKYKEFYNDGKLRIDTEKFERFDFLPPDISKKNRISFYADAHMEYYENQNLKKRIGKPLLRSYEEFYQNGQLRLKTFVNNEYLKVGIKCFFGSFESYHENGQIKIISNYSQTLLDGLYLEYFESGILKIKTTYCQGKVDGSYKEFFKNGSLKIHKEPTTDIPNITIKNENINYFIYKEFYQNGQQKIAAFIKQDVKRSAIFRKGVKCRWVSPKWLFEGPYKEYFIDGKLKISTQYRYHDIYGSFKQYYKNGRLKIETVYGKFGKKGKYKQYYKSGSLKIKTKYVGDYIDGEYLEYFENGQIKISSNYIITKQYSSKGGFFDMYDLLNNKHGLHKEYDKSGMVLTRKFYNHGIEDHTNDLSD